MINSMSCLWCFRRFAQVQNVGFSYSLFFLGETASTVDSDHSDDLQLGQDQIGAEGKGGEESRQAKIPNNHEGSELTLHEPIINRHPKATITPACHHAAMPGVGRLLSSGLQPRINQ